MTQSRPPRRSRPGARSSTKPQRAVEELHPTLDPPDIHTFREWPLEPEVQDVIEEMGIVEPTPIQKLAIQPILDGKDVIAKAETGTGKTLAFGAPMMSRVEPGRTTVLGLVLCPTRELAQQVAVVLEKLGEPRGVKVALVVGGDPMHPQVEALRAGAQIVVGTPGRVLDLYGQKFLSFPWTEFAVLDEADEMLEIGFIDDVKKILGHCPDERQTLLFSATFPPELLRLAREYTTDPVEIATAKGVASVDSISHAFLEVDERDRQHALKRLIASTAEDDVLLVFCDRRVEVERLMRVLERTRFSIKALHGGYDQASRFRVMSAFRDGQVKVLVATDVASRGLDIHHVTHVVNYSVPRDITDYTHRCGRTGRAGRTGKAITLVTGLDRKRWRALQERMTWEVTEVVDSPYGPVRASEAKAGAERSAGGAERTERTERSERPARGGRNSRRTSRSDDGGRGRERADSSERETERETERAAPEARPERSATSEVERPRRRRRDGDRDRTHARRGSGERERPEPRSIERADTRDDSAGESEIPASRRPARREHDAERARSQRTVEEPRETPRPRRTRDASDEAPARDERPRSPRRSGRGRGPDRGERPKERGDEERERRPRADRDAEEPRHEPRPRRRGDDDEPRLRAPSRGRARDDAPAERPARRRERPADPSSGFGAGL